MAYFKGDVRSSTLQMQTALHVILPYDCKPPNAQTPCKVLYLLHGHTESAASWMRWTSLERYARAAGVAVIMPEVQRSFYTDMAFGLPYFSYITQELPTLCTQMFGIGGRREDTFVAGQSMGGYGALRCALTYPERYSACAVFSGCLDIDSVAQRRPDLLPELQGIFGQELNGIGSNDLFCAAERAAVQSPDQLPHILIRCGTEDSFLAENTRLHRHLQALGYQTDYAEWSGGHDWQFWDDALKQTLPTLLERA